LLFHKISPSLQIELAASVLPSLAINEQRQLAHLIQNSALAAREAATLRALVPVRRRIEIWNSLADPGLFVDEIEALLAQMYQTDFDRSERVELLRQLSEKILLLPQASTLRKLLPLRDRFDLYAQIADHTEFEEEIAFAMREEGDVREEESPSRDFWIKQDSLDPTSALFGIAPAYFKKRYWQSRYAGLLYAIREGVSTDKLPRSAWSAAELYGKEISSEDRDLAERWAFGEYPERSETKPSDAKIAQMLSARCAEKAARFFYEGLGRSVKDIAIHQLTGEANTG
jgi:hypothetical protein